MDMEKISLPIRTKFEYVEKINEEFTRCKCYIMALGKNRNGSHFSRESVEAAIPTFANIPVVAYLYEDENGNRRVAGHEMEIVENKEGELQWHSLCVPYGTVPESGAFTFVDVTEADGTVATYLCKDVILWTGRYPEIMDAAFSEDSYFNQSMEIKVSESSALAEDERYKDITGFSASALWLLGKSDDDEYNVEPCFPSASVVPFALDEQFSTLMDEFKNALAECFSKRECDGGNDNGAIELDVVPHGAEETNVTTEAHKEMPFAHTYNQKREAMNKAVCGLDHNDIDGNCIYYYVVDFDDTYAYIEQIRWVKEYREEKHYRIAYSYNDADNVVTLADAREEMFLKWLTQDELDALGRTQDDFNAYVESHSYENSEVEDLKAYKQKRMADDYNTQLSELESQFEDISDDEAYKSIMATAHESQADGCDIDVLMEKLYAIRGRIVAPAKKVSQKAKDFRVPIVKANDDVEPYGGLFSLYRD